jgi:ABC-2 type transport system ATP-binding protein
MGTVELECVSKSYESKVAVNDLSLCIEAGTMFGLLGPNGAGKTSTIRMMIGIILPDSGTVRLFGNPFSRGLVRRVGYLPEERGLYQKMTVGEQLEFIGQLSGLDAATAGRRTQEWCERLQIDGVGGKKTEDLSKGMQQKIQFIAALIHDPDLIIMDEPFAGLDPVNAILLQEVLLEKKKAGRTILFSTHRMDQVEKLCDAICLINGGRAVLSGSMRSVKSNYKRNRVVIEFEGDDSFLHCEAVESYRNSGGQADIRLKDGADSQDILHAAAAKARIYRFELVEPSLEEIFIDAVGGKADA